MLVDEDEEMKIVDCIGVQIVSGPPNMWIVDRGIEYE